MNSVDEKIIEQSKSKIAGGIVGSGAFVAIGMWLLSVDATTIRSQRSFSLFLNNPTYAHGLGVAAIVFFGLCGILLIKRLFNKKPGLVFDNSGIVDNSSSVSAGFIPWSEIVGSEIFDLQRQRILVIMVKDPQKYIERGNSVRRTLNIANNEMCGSPIAISSNALKINFPELQALFNEYQRKYGNASSNDGRGTFEKMVQD
jgi:hypothetical protein